MTETLETWLLGYPALGLACAISGLGMPVPEDVLVLYAGLSVGTGRFDWLPATLVVFFGVLLRDSLAWLLGKALGARLLEAGWLRSAMGGERLDRVTSLLRERGEVAVFGGRFLVGLRAPMFAVAGASGIPYRRFVQWDLLGLCVTTPALLLTGYWLGPPALTLADALLPYLRNLVVALIVLAALWLARGGAARPT